MQPLQQERAVVASPKWKGLRACSCPPLRVNKLITVVPLHSRYVARTGDVVVGRIVDVRNKQWYVA